MCFYIIFTHNNWRFTSHQGLLATSAEIDQIEAEIGVHPGPEILFPSSVLTIEHGHRKFPTLTFSGQEALRFAKFSEVDAFPVASLRPLQVKDAGTWRKSRGATPTLEISHDWTFSTSYQGTTAATFVDEEEISENFMPYDLLRDEKIPILHFGQVAFWEDELHDNGGCEFSAKFRVTEIYFYVLAEYSLNLVGVADRKIQTRYFHVFGHSEIRRETKCLEASNLLVHKQSRFSL